MKGFLVLSTILASLVSWLFWAAPDADAAPVFAVTRVEWAGNPCVQVYGASQNNPYLIGAPVWQCDTTPGMHWAEWVESRTTGQVVGVDPEMGGNAWISCTLWVNGRIEAHAEATAGNGVQVSCLRTVS